MKQLKKDRKNGLLGTRTYKYIDSNGHQTGGHKMYVYDTEKHAAKKSKKKK